MLHSSPVASPNSQPTPGSRATKLTCHLNRDAWANPGKVHHAWPKPTQQSIWPIALWKIINYYCFKHLCFRMIGCAVIDNWVTAAFMGQCAAIFLDCHKFILLIFKWSNFPKKNENSPVWFGSVDQVQVWEPWGLWYNSQSGHMPGL